MAWQRKERVKCLMQLLEEVRRKGELPYIEALKFIMNMEMVSRLTAERYIQDFLFQGKFTWSKEGINIKLAEAAK